MKLIYCPKCHDLRKLGMATTTCQCGESSGYYEADGLNAVIKGEAIPVGINNHLFAHAVKRQRTKNENNKSEALGIEFTAFIIPANAPTIRREK